MSLPTAPAGPPGEIDWPEGVLFGLLVGERLWLSTSVILALQMLADVVTVPWWPVASSFLAVVCGLLRRRWKTAKPQGVVLALRLALAGGLALGSVWGVFKALGRLL